MSSGRESRAADRDWGKIGAETDTLTQDRRDSQRDVARCSSFHSLHKRHPSKYSTCRSLTIFALGFLSGARSRWPPLSSGPPDLKWITRINPIMHPPSNDSRWMPRAPLTPPRKAVIPVDGHGGDRASGRHLRVEPKQRRVDLGHFQTSKYT